jgi:hypothetical protein
MLKSIPPPETSNVQLVTTYAEFARKKERKNRIYDAEAKFIMSCHQRICHSEQKSSHYKAGQDF